MWPRCGGGRVGLGQGLGYLTGPSLCLQRSFTLIVEAWDWDNDTTPDGELAPAGWTAACRASLRALGG